MILLYFIEILKVALLQKRNNKPKYLLKVNCKDKKKKIKNKFDFVSLSFVLMFRYQTLYSKQVFALCQQVRQMNIVFDNVFITFGLNWSRFLFLYLSPLKSNVFFP